MARSLRRERRAVRRESPRGALRRLEADHGVGDRRGDERWMRGPTNHCDDIDDDKAPLIV